MTETAEHTPKADARHRICHCGKRATLHDVESGPKLGAYHCDACGCCFTKDGPREGHAACLSA